MRDTASGLSARKHASESLLRTSSEDVQVSAGYANIDCLCQINRNTRVGWRLTAGNAVGMVHQAREADCQTTRTTWHEPGSMLNPKE